MCFANTGTDTEYSPVDLDEIDDSGIFPDQSNRMRQSDHAMNPEHKKVHRLAPVSSARLSSRKRAFCQVGICQIFPCRKLACVGIFLVVLARCAGSEQESVCRTREDHPECGVTLIVQQPGKSLLPFVADEVCFTGCKWSWVFMRVFDVSASLLICKYLNV